MVFKQVRATIRKYGMLKKHDRVLVAVSGGPDSVALVHLLNALRKEMGLELNIVHLDHMIRRQESLDDMDFVKALAEKMGIEIIIERVNVLDMVKSSKRSLEECARIARYDFFLRAARERSIERIATGHTRDDQAETVLMRLIRGSGLSGLSGISPCKPMDGRLIIRPLIEVWRKEIEDYLKRNKIAFRRDSSNLDPVFFRNKIRHQLLPVLEKEYNTGIKEILVNLAENVNLDYNCLAKIGERKFRAAAKTKKGNKGNEVALDLNKLRRFHKAIQKMVLRLAIKETRGDLKRITYQHWKELEELIRDRPGGSIVDLPRNVTALKKDNKIRFYLRT